MTVTTTAADLARTLRLAALFADDPHEGFPGLSAVFLEAGGGTLTATATDRYKLGHARTTADGELPTDGILIPARFATWIADGLNEVADREEVTLEATGVDVDRLLPGTLRVATAAITATVPTTKGPGGQTPGRRGNWIDYRKVFGDYAEPAGAPVCSTSPVLLSPRIVGVLTAVAEIVPIATSRWTTVDPHKPVRVEVDNVLTALLMPMRADRRVEEYWPIPVGVPTPVPA